MFEGQSCNLCNSTEDYKTKINWGEEKNYLRLQININLKKVMIVLFLLMVVRIL